MAGCKFWKREQYKACQQIAQRLAVTAFQFGWKSIEVVQAFACMTYWKEPTDTVRAGSLINRIALNADCVSLLIEHMDVHWIRRPHGS